MHTLTDAVYVLFVIIHSAAHLIDYLLYLIWAGTGLYVDNLPGKVFKEMSRDTKLFVLRILGSSASAPKAIFIAALLSAGAALAEEFFFRGIVFNSIDASAGLPTAFLLSSVTYAFHV
jgi:membrane protease YdiL (CAAX protease family)